MLPWRKRESPLNNLWHVVFSILSLLDTKTSVKQLRRWTGGWQRGMEKRKRALRWEWRRPWGNFPFTEVWDTHAHTLQYIQACTRTHCASTVAQIWHLCTLKNAPYTHRYMWCMDMQVHTDKRIHTCPMNILQPRTEEREEGVGVVKE